MTVIGQQFVRIKTKAAKVHPPFHLKQWKWIRFCVLMAVDTLIISATFFATFWLRFDTGWSGYTTLILRALPVMVATHLAVYWWLGMYRQVWRYANYSSAVIIAKSVVVSQVLAVASSYLVGSGLPRSIYIIHGLLVLVFIGLIRFSWRGWTSFQTSLNNPTAPERCLIYGAGSGGDLLARHILANPRFPYQAIGFIDDDINKIGRQIHGLRILGTGESLAEICEEQGVSAVILAMPSVPGKLIRKVVTLCHSVTVRPLIMPDMANSLSDEVFRPRDVDIRDLLRRAPKAIDHVLVKGFFSRKTVLVTGAGGSIGSEICRQLVNYKPDRLILLDSSEFNLYQIETELSDMKLEDVELLPVLGSVTDRRFVKQIFDKFKPNVVLHAAAYKHVPIIESNPIEGILNNVKGTLNLAREALEHRVERFLLISTDKAVRPTSIMGSTKRCCELLVQALYTIDRTCGFCAVRFGNVLGSSGSVVPRFMEQIKNGGPVTVTHPEVTRYFMLTSEAVGLVLQSITMSKGGEVFVLNMGEPVKIFDMAQQLIILAGKEPNRDIDIVCTGLRPGEKLYEELILEGAEQQTTHDEVFVAVPNPVDPNEVLNDIEEIIEAAELGNAEVGIHLLKLLVSKTARPGKNTVRDDFSLGGMRSAPIH